MNLKEGLNQEEVSLESGRSSGGQGPQMDSCQVGWHLLVFFPIQAWRLY